MISEVNRLRMKLKTHIPTHPLTHNTPHTITQKGMNQTSRRNQHLAYQSMMQLSNSFFFFPGHQCNVTNVAPVACNIGWYNDDPQNQMCQQCPEGSYCADATQAPQTCDSGKCQRSSKRSEVNPSNKMLQQCLEGRTLLCWCYTATSNLWFGKLCKMSSYSLGHLKDIYSQFFFQYLMKRTQQ